MSTKPITKLPASKQPRFNYSSTVEGMRFPRSSREAFGVPVSFKKERNPDAPVAWACAIGACVLTYLILAGLA
jgi:hypothetical protein